MKRAHDLSGAEKRKAKKLKQENAVRNTRSLCSFLTVESSTATPPAQTKYAAGAAEGTDVASEADDAVPCTSHQSLPSEEDYSDTEPEPASDVDDAQPTPCLVVEPCRFPSDPITDDPASWRKLSDCDRINLVSKGPVQVCEHDFPLNEETPKRRFTTNNYYLNLANNEKVCRSWLVYSTSVDSVYCFPCFLLGDGKCRSGFSAESGFGNKWSTLSKALKEHEGSVHHKECMLKWHVMRSDETVDKATMNQIREEQKYWKSVLWRLISIIQFLAERNLALRGASEKFGDARNGNFLGEVELISKFDPILAEHVRRAKSKELGDHYLSNKIQNELISLLGSATQQKIVSRVIQSKYYSIMVDCTPDLSHTEQLSIVIRGVDVNESIGAEVYEHFVEFVGVSDTTGKGLCEEILLFLAKFGIPVADCRGQGYDNGSNMRGKTKGTQARLLEINPKAAYMPCASHRLNLVIADAAKSSVVTILFFGYLQRMYNLFSASTKRWQILKKHVTKITVKNLPDTRWEAKCDAVKALRYQTAEVVAALEELERLAVECKDGVVVTECRSLSNEIRSWRFLVCLIIWYDLLFQINMISKALQSPKMCLDDQIAHVEAGMKFVSEYREEGLVSAEVTARELAEDLEVDRSYPEPRRRKKTRLFSYESIDSDQQTGEDVFRTQFFYPLLDVTFSSLQERFKEMKDFQSNFGFLCGLASMQEAVGTKTLASHCADLANGPTSGDVSAFDLEREITSFVGFASQRKLHGLSAIECLRYIHKHSLVDLYPNLSVSLRILVSLPVTVASCERSFSKLKLIKTYLRSTMSQERLVGLSVISIEHEICRSIDMHELVDKFASMKSRKVILQ